MSDDADESKEPLRERVPWRRLAYIGGTLGGLALLAVLLLGAVELLGLVFTAVILVALLAGVALLPTVWYLLGQSLPRGLRSVGARIVWTIAAIIHGPYVLEWTERGTVEIRPADPETDRMRVDGEWVEFDPDGNWSRLGKSQFGVAWEKSDEAMGGTAVRAREDPKADGGILDLGQRGDEHIATRFVSTAENLVVDVSRVVNRYRGAAGGDIADAAKLDGLRDHGGGGSIGAKWLIIGIISSLALGAISGWVMFAA